MGKIVIAHIPRLTRPRGYEKMLRKGSHKQSQSRLHPRLVRVIQTQGKRLVRALSQDPKVGAIVLAHLPRLTRPSWLDEQPVEESPILSSEKSDINSREHNGTGSGHGGGGDHRGTPTKADPLRRRSIARTA